MWKKSKIVIFDGWNEINTVEDIWNFFFMNIFISSGETEEYIFNTHAILYSC